MLDIAVKWGGGGEQVTITAITCLGQSRPGALDGLPLKVRLRMQA